MLKDQKKPQPKTMKLGDPMTRRPTEDVRAQKGTGKGKIGKIGNLGKYAHEPKRKG